MNWIEVKSKEEVCLERANAAAAKKHDEKIAALMQIFKETKSGLDAQEIYKERRRKKKTAREMYDYFLENYEFAEDSLVKESDKRRISLKDAAEVLSQSLGSLEGLDG